MVLTWVDYSVIAAYLVAITAFGSWFARFQRTTRDYFLTSRSVPWWAICFTIVATETSTLSFIGVPAEVFSAPSARYTGNMTFLQLVLGYLIGRVLVGVLFIPAYFRGDLYTSYELLQRRFGAPVKNLAAIIFLVNRSLADGVRLYATALVIAVVTQVPVWWTVVALGGAMIVYTVRGGVSAVIWTDVVQMFVYVAGALLVAAGAFHAIGGWSAVIEAGTAAGKFAVLDMSTDPRRVYTLWSGLAGGVALTLATHGTDQFLVQRLLSARSAADAGRGLVLSGVIVFVQFTLFLIIGVMLYAYYLAHPLPPGTQPDQVLATFVVHVLPAGVVGFIVAAIVAAALSPSVNAMAATTVNDFYLRYWNPNADQPTLMAVSRGATVFWGLVQLAVALGAQWMNQSVLSAGLSILSLAAGPVLGAFLTGVLTARVGSWAMLGGMLAGIAAMTVVWWTGAFAWTWYALLGASITGLAALGLSIALPRVRHA
jgi:SSS family solute:Na+ symporter